MSRNASLGALFTVLAMLGFASMDAISKLLVVNYSVGQLLWVRYGVFCVFAWLIVRRRGLRASFATKQPAVQIFRALLAVVESAVFVLAFRYLSLTNTHAVAATSPLIVIALGVLLLNEKAGLGRWLAVLAGFVGMILVVRPGLRAFDWPSMLPLTGAFLWAGYQILLRVCARTDSPDTTLVWSASVAFIATSFVGPWQWLWLDTAGWTMVLATAVLNALANYALIRALDYAEASAIQPYSYTLLVWVTILGILIFGDWPDRHTLLGATIIVGSGFYSWWSDRKAATSATA
ncbi:MAG TPA: DMT family transporter [Reyranella sp.]|nr:DMT family transporter [Reyranella sp.]